MRSSCPTANRSLVSTQLASGKTSRCPTLARRPRARSAHWIASRWSPSTRLSRMPAGLDGHPSPIRTLDRDAVLSAVADRVCSVERPRVLVGIDGRSGSGKSTFADELAGHLGQRGRVVIRSTTDSFHRPREERLAGGTTSADGYYLDSHDLDRIGSELLNPFREGADRVLVAAFDEPTDTACEEIVDVATDAVLVFDGLFLHRAEFAAAWDVSVYLDADERRDTEWLQYLLTDLPDDVSETRRRARSPARHGPVAALPTRLGPLHQRRRTRRPSDSRRRQQRPRTSEDSRSDLTRDASTGRHTHHGLWSLSYEISCQSSASTGIAHIGSGLQSCQRLSNGGRRHSMSSMVASASVRT